MGGHYEDESIRKELRDLLGRGMCLSYQYESIRKELREKVLEDLRDGYITKNP